MITKNRGALLPRSNAPLSLQIRVNDDVLFHVFCVHLDAVDAELGDQCLPALRHVCIVVDGEAAVGKVAWLMADNSFVKIGGKFPSVYIGKAMPSRETEKENCPQSGQFFCYIWVSHMPQKESMGSLPVKASGPVTSASTRASIVSSLES